jgi:hypothetical protein
MIFEINSKKDKFVEDIYDKGMKELDKFFELGWIRNTPFIFVVPDRKTIDKLRREKTEDWLVAWADSRSRIIYLLDKKNLEKESNHKYSKETYTARIKHELTHMFVSAYSKLINIKPCWLNEGIAIYLSEQNKFKENPIKFSKFLESYDKITEGVYDESGFFVEFLIKKFGKEKLLKLIKSLKDNLTKEEFNKNFKEIYKFDLTYNKINRLIMKK